MLKKEQLSSSNQISIPSRKFLLLFNDTHNCRSNMVKRSFTIHKLDNAAALAFAYDPGKSSLLSYRQAVVKGDEILGLLHGAREEGEASVCSGAKLLKDTYSNDDDDGILSMPRPDRLPAKAPRFDSSQRPRSFLTFARRSMTDPRVLPYHHHFRSASFFTQPYK